MLFSYDSYAVMPNDIHNSWAFPQAMQKLDTAEAELSRLRGDLQARPGMEGPGLVKSLGRYKNC